MAERLYDVAVEGIAGDLLVKWDSIRSVRSWARRSFPGVSVIVSAHKEGKRCNVCDSKPCVCQKPATPKLTNGT